MSFWDQKYNTIEYGYGLKPNEFYSSLIQRLNPGRILLPGEGEGRNAVFAAKHGWEVTAFDASKVARDKALALAKKNNVNVNYYLNTVHDYISNQKFDLIAVIYLHLLPEERKIFHRKLMEMLSEKGILVMEVFSKEQIKNSSGGPKNMDMLYTLGNLQQDFASFTIQKLEQLEVTLDEGEWHKGKANVIRAIISK